MDLLLCMLSFVLYMHVLTSRQCHWRQLCQGMKYGSLGSLLWLSNQGMSVESFSVLQRDIQSEQFQATEKTHCQQIRLWRNEIQRLCVPLGRV